MVDDEREAEPDEAEGAVDPLAEALRNIAPSDKVCGNCLIWKPQRSDANGRWLGPCRLMLGRGDLPATAAVCERFLPRGSKVPVAPPPEPTRRRSHTISGPTVRRAGATVARGGTSYVSSPRPPKPDVELGDLLAMTRNELIEILRDALGEGDMPALANKWEGGTVLLKPGNPELQAKELPVDALLHKVVMIRDRLRVLEQKLNAHPKLTPGEKIDLQGYITKCYGSLTTFNVLFKDEADRFVGEKSKDD